MPTAAAAPAALAASTSLLSKAGYYLDLAAKIVARGILVPREFADFPGGGGLGRLDTIWRMTHLSGIFIWA